MAAGRTRRRWRRWRRIHKRPIIIGGMADPIRKDDLYTPFRRGNGTLDRPLRPDSDKDRDILNTVPQRSEED